MGLRVIDCTHTAVKATSEHEFAYVNRDNFNSINMQICDAQMSLTKVVVRWPGLTQDSCFSEGEARGAGFKLVECRTGGFFMSDVFKT